MTIRGSSPIYEGNWKLISSEPHTKSQAMEDGCKIICIDEKLTRIEHCFKKDAVVTTQIEVLGSNDLNIDLIYDQSFLDKKLIKPVKDLFSDYDEMTRSLH